MKLLFKKIIANIRPIFQIIGLILIGAMPSILNLSEMLSEKLELEISQQWLDYVLYIAWKTGDIAIGALFVITTLFTIRKLNKECVFNKGDTYKNYPYIWYWICAKILGYLECNLVLVPIYMQFKLVIRDTFDEYHYGNFRSKDNDKIIVNYKNISDAMTSVNLIIADTYPVDSQQLHRSVLMSPMIIISRDNEVDHNRYDSPDLVNAVVNEISSLPRSVNQVHIFATTNPKNTVGIVRNAFKLGERGNLDKIIVYQQGNVDSLRLFESKGKVVYSK